MTEVNRRSYGDELTAGPAEAGYFATVQEFGNLH